MGRHWHNARPNSGNMVYAVSELASQIKGTVLTPGDEGYQDAIRRWASNAERNAAVVAQVTSSQDVAAAVLTPPDRALCMY